MAKEVEVTIKPKLDPLDAVTVRPGDKLILRVRHDISMQEFDEFRERFTEKLPGVDLVVVNAEQMLVYRSDGDA